LQEFYL